MTYKLIAIDMDNTLLNSKKEITDKNKDIIKLAKNKGIKIVLCSGRFYNEMYSYVKELGLFENNQYMITNGGAIIENCNKKRIYQDTMSLTSCHKLSSFLESHYINFQFVEINGQTYSRFEEWEKAKQKNNKLEIVKVLFQDSREVLDQLSYKIVKQFGQDFFVVRPGDEFLEMFPKNVNKGQAVKWLSKYLHIDLKQVMAIGDMYNDISMIELAGNGIAMGNAVDKVKDVSDHVTLNNEQSGVGVAIEKYALGLS